MMKLFCSSCSFRLEKKKKKKILSSVFSKLIEHAVLFFFFHHELYSHEWSRTCVMLITMHLARITRIGVTLTAIKVPSAIIELHRHANSPFSMLSLYPAEFLNLVPSDWFTDNTRRVRFTSRTKRNKKKEIYNSISLRCIANA